jgi:EpsI family protein
MKLISAYVACGALLTALWGGQLWFEAWAQTRMQSRALELQKPLSEFPYAVGNWLKRDVDLDPDVVRAAEADQILRRDYLSTDGQRVGVYITYYGGLHRFIPHGLGTCYPMGGWKLSRALTLNGPDDAPAWQLFLFEKELDRHLVLYTHYVNGKRLASISWTRLHFASGLLGGARGSIIQVELFSNVSGGLSDSRQRLQDFAQLLAPVLDEYLPHDTNEPSD